MAAVVVLPKYDVTRIPDVHVKEVDYKQEWITSTHGHTYNIVNYMHSKHTLATCDSGMNSTQLQGHVLYVKNCKGHQIFISYEPLPHDITPWANSSIILIVKWCVFIHVDLDSTIIYTVHVHVNTFLASM